MDNSTIHGDNVSEFSVPYKESRPTTPAVPRLPAYTSRTNSPLGNALPLTQPHDYFAAQRPSSRGAYRNVDMTPGYTPGYTPDDVYELHTIASQRSYDQRSYESRTSDEAQLLQHGSDGRGRSRDPTPTRGARGYM